MDKKLSLDLDTLEIETFVPVPVNDEESADVQAYAATVQGTCMGYTCFITCSGKFC